MKGDTPQLMLMSKESVLNSLPEVHFPIPSYMRRGPAAPPPVSSKCAWEIMDNLRIKVNCATYVNVKELDKVSAACKVSYASFVVVI